MKSHGQTWAHLIRAWRVVLGLLATCPVAHALDPATAVKDYRQSEWQVPDGLPYPGVTALAQSADGYLWIATRMGLARFDGVAFTVFTPANLPQLTSERISSFCLARDGTLWIGTEKGVLCYADGRWWRPSADPRIDEGDVCSLFEEADGSFLVNCRARLLRLRGSAVTELTLSGGGQTPRLNVITRDAHGTVYLAGRGVMVETADSLRDISAEAGVVKAWIQGMSIDPKTGVWFGTQTGLVNWNAGTRRTLTAREGLPSSAVRSTLIDHDGNLWVGTTNGLARYENGTFQPLLQHGIDSLSNILCLFEDRETNLWVGTDRGLYRVQDVRFANLTQRDGLPVNSVLCVLQARDGTRWVGTFGGGLARFTATEVQRLRVADGLLEDNITALTEDTDGTLWIAYSARGVSSYRNGKFRHYQPPAQDDRVVGIGFDPSGAVWLNDSKGLFRLTNDQFERVTVDESLGTAGPLHVDREGVIWLGGSNGFGRFDGRQWVHFAGPKSIAGKNTRCIFSGDDGEIWALHDGPGLLRIRHGQRADYPLPTALGPIAYSGFVYRGELWLSTRGGVVRIPLSEFDAIDRHEKANPSYTVYSEADGMRSSAPNLPAEQTAAIMNDGHLWFATSGGIAVTHPATLRANRQPPPVVIEHVWTDKRELPRAEWSNVPPGRGELAFQFTGLSFVNPARVRFKYRLVGFDTNWSEPTNRRDAHYGGLSPGPYRFEVVACNDEGVWSPTAAVCDLVLRPHFYERWSFYALLAVGTFGGVAGVIRWRTRKLVREKLELQRRIGEATGELRLTCDALRSSEYFYHSLVESLPHVIVRKDPAGRYTFANAAFSELVGRPIDEIVGRTDADLYPTAVAAKHQAEDAAVLRNRQPVEREEVTETTAGRRRYLVVKKLPLVDAAGGLLGIQVLFWDMTAFRETEEKLKTAQHELVEISRLAGMAEMATGILHNIGNALNSVKTAGAVALASARRLDGTRVHRVAQLLASEESRLAEFLTRDDRGHKLPSYLAMIGVELDQGRDSTVKEMREVLDGIEHIAQIVAAQQDTTRIAAITEDVAPAELLEYAWRMNADSLDGLGTSIVREYAATPPVRVPRQKALQVLLNLMRNAYDSLKESGRADPCLTMGLRQSGNGEVEFSIADNGMGIPPDNLTRIFEFGYTTKIKGHGFGLHSSALAAREMRGSLRLESAGLGRGAIAILTLPVSSPEPHPLVSAG